MFSPLYFMSKPASTHFHFLKKSPSEKKNLSFFLFFSWYFFLMTYIYWDEKKAWKSKTHLGYNVKNCFFGFFSCFFRFMQLKQSKKNKKDVFRIFSTETAELICHFLVFTKKNKKFSWLFGLICNACYNKNDKKHKKSTFLNNFWSIFTCSKSRGTHFY